MDDHLNVRSGAAIRIALISVGLISCGRSILHAQRPQDRLLAAAEHSRLDSPGLKPWHLKLDVTLYDENGKNPIAGTIERWNAGNGSRTIFTFGDAKRTVLNDGDKFYAAHTGLEVPALADGVLEAILNPGPSNHEVESSTPELQTENFGKVKLDCLMLSESIRHEGKIALGLFPTYCMDPGGQILRATFNFGSYTVLRNEISDFQGHDVANSLLFIQGQKTHVAEARITTLEIFGPSANQFAPGDSMKAASAGMVRVSGGVIAGQIVKKVQPTYPASARQAHIGGTVILLAIVGRDGHIRYLRPISAPDTDLALAAIAAVRQWTYAPYLLNGEPTEVETTVTVNFNLNRF
jgi:TonB family protein